MTTVPRFWICPGLILAFVCCFAACGSSDGGKANPGTGGASGANGKGGAGGAGGGNNTGGSGPGSGGAPGADAGSGGTSGGLTTYRTCSDETRAGRFTLALNNDAETPFSSMDGFVSDAIDSSNLPKRLATIDGCVVMQPPNAVECKPECASDKLCTSQGCVALPKPHDLGKVTVTGLKQPLELANINNLYENPPMTLAHPGFVEGADIALTAVGAGGYGPFTLKGVGVAPLEVSMTPVVIEGGKPATFTWNAPSKTTPGKVHIKVGVNLHGDVDTWFECDVPDTGSFTATAALTTELFKYGVSGFPGIELTRRTADTTTVPSGCLEFVVAAPVSRSLKVPGVDSCMDDGDCTGGKTCQPDLVCK